MYANHLPQHRLLTPLRVFLVAAVVFCLMTPHGVQAQTGGITITVRDQQGAVVSGINVTLTGSGTNQTITRQTDDQGVARFDGLPPGTYTVSVEAAGFAKMTRSGISVVVGGLQNIDVVMTPGPGVEEVTVSSEGERSQVLSAIPNLNNDLTPLLQILPGAVPTSPSTLGKIVIDGKGKDQQTVRLDGVDSTALIELPSGDAALDVLSGFQKPDVAFDLDNKDTSTQSRAFAPRFGPGTGSVADGVSFSGGSAWTGQFTVEHRNDVFNARNFFDSDQKNGIHRSRFSGKLGGPLSRGNRLPIFLAYEGIRGRTERDAYEAVPAEAACNCAAPFMRGFLPSGTEDVPGASLDSNFLVARRRVRASADADNFNVRLDPFISKKLGTTFRFTRLNAENVVPDGVTGREQRQRVFFNNALAEFKFSNRVDFVHDIRLSLNQTAARVRTDVPTVSGFDLSRSLITTGGSPAVQGLPGQPATLSIASLGGFNKGNLRMSPISYNVSYDYTRPVGWFGKVNTLFLGTEARFVRLSFDKPGGVTYSFPDVAALRTGTPGTVTFLSDLSEPSPFGNGAGTRHAAQEYYMGYFHVETKVTQRFTLTYGLRYDYFGAARERDDRAVVVDPDTGAILPSGTSFYHASRNNFQPRFGLSLTSDETGLIRNMELRAGAGLYSGVPLIGSLLLPIESDRVSTSFTGGPFPVDPSQVTRAFVDNPNTRQFQPLSFARDFTTPERAYKWEASLSRTFKDLYDLKLTYTGNVGRNLPLAGVANRIVGVKTNADPTLPATVIRQFDGLGGDPSFRPFGEFFFRTSRGRSSYNGLTIQFKRNSINAPKEGTELPRWLRLKDLNVSYTLARNVGNASGDVASNPLDFGADYGYNASDARHTFNLTAVYNLWEAFGMDDAKGHRDLFRGWQFAPAISARSGLPLVVRLDRPDIVYMDASGSVFASPGAGRTAVVNTPGGGSVAKTRVPNLIPGIDPYLHDRFQILNPAAFSIPAPGAFGNLRRGQLRGPSSVQFDLGVTRYLFDHESVRGDFRVDIFNIFNHANFGNPTAVLPNLLGTSAADNQIQPGAPFTRISVPAFGVVTAADPGRLIQFSFTFRFKNGFTN